MRSWALLASALLASALLAVGCTLPEVERAEELAAQADWDGAVAAYRQATRQDPWDEDIEAQLDHAKAMAAAQHYRAGKAALKDQHVAQALREFEFAVGFDPSRVEHHAALVETLRLREARERLRTADRYYYMGRFEDAIVSYERAATLDPELTEALDGLTAATAQHRVARSITPSRQPVTLRFQKAKLREVFEILARTAGVNVVFDKDVRDDPVTIFLKDMPYQEALNLILNTNNLAAHRVAANTLLITPATKQKRAQYQDLMIRTFFLSNTDAKKAVNLLRSMLESKRVYADEAVNAVVVRDEPAKLHLAERVIYAIDRRQPEVELEVEVLEVDRTKTLEYGTNYAKSLAAGVVPDDFTGSAAPGLFTFTYEELINLGTTNYVFTLPSALLFDFFKQEADAKTLVSPKLRVVNKEKATINVGDQFPILLSTSNVLPGQASTGSVPTVSTVTSTEFKDTGVKLTVEPTVHMLDELTLKLNIELTRVGEKVILQEDPEISQFKFGTRQAETSLRLRDGETVVLAGLISDEHRRSRTSVPWLDDVPLLGDLLRSTETQTITTELVLAITPRIIRPVETPGPEEQIFWSGTQTRFATNRVFTAEPRMVPVTNSDSAAGHPDQPAAQAPPGGPSTERPPRVSEQALPRSERHPSERGDPHTEAQGPRQPHGIPEQPAAPEATTQPESGTRVARGAGVLAIRPPQLLTRVGQEFGVSLTAQHLGQLEESVVAVHFDASVVEFVRASEGMLLHGSAAAAGATVGGNPEAGQLVLHVRRQATAPEVSGGLVGLVFRAKAPGTTRLTLEPATVRGAAGHALAVEVRPGTVVVQ